jgi:rhomboid protease GluP
MTVGASAATSGILGALLCLWILGKIDLTASFFATNIGLNVALTLMDARINWVAHLVGFTAGLIACAVLDLIERALRRLLRCKFPESIKANLLLLACAGAALGWSAGVTVGSPAIVGAVLLAIVLAVVKLIDITLALRHGVAVVVVLLALANATAIILGVALNLAQIKSACALRPAVLPSAIDAIIATGCTAPQLAALALGALAFILTLLLQAEPLRRGFGDVGFVAASLQAARARADGL